MCPFKSSSRWIVTLTNCPLCCTSRLCSICLNVCHHYVARERMSAKLCDDFQGNFRSVFWNFSKPFRRYFLRAREQVRFYLPIRECVANLKRNDKYLLHFYCTRKWCLYHAFIGITHMRTNTWIKKKWYEVYRVITMMKSLAGAWKNQFQTN